MVVAVIVISIIIFVASAIFMVYNFIKFKNFNVDDMMKEGEKILKQNQETINEIKQNAKKYGYDIQSAKDGKIICEYCGTLVDKNAYKCPSCGATKK